MKIRNNGNEELQTRREFFKKTAKSVLPIMGVVAFGPAYLTSCGGDGENGVISDGGDSDGGCSACTGLCTISCGNACKANAWWEPASCPGTCKNACFDKCNTSCIGSNKSPGSGGSSGGSSGCSSCSSSCTSTCKGNCYTGCNRLCTTSCRIACSKGAY